MNLFVVHAILNLLAWGLFAPIGVIIARHGRSRLGSKWILYHLSLMLLTGLCSVTAVSLAVYAVDAHLVTWHQWLGVVITLALLVQASIGLVLYRGSVALRTRTKLAQLHRICGLFFLSLAWINITLGIFEYYGGRDKAPPFVLYGWLGLVSAWILTGGILEFRRRK